MNFVREVTAIYTFQFWTLKEKLFKNISHTAFRKKILKGKNLLLSIYIQNDLRQNHNVEISK